MGNEHKIALITGATSGFGKVIAEHLVQKGYTLLFIARSEDKALSLKTALQGVYPNANIDYVIGDFSSFQSIVHACKTIHEKYTQIDLMILNAGLWNFEFRETEDKIEETLQVNLLAPLLLFYLLKDLLPAHVPTKVIFTASGLHQGNIQFDDLECRKKFSGFKTYRQSKLGVILMTRLLAQLPEYTNLCFCAVHPGMVKTQLGKQAGWLSRTIFHLMGQSIEKGAQTHLYLIDEDMAHLKSGEYYANSRVTKSSATSYDMELAKKLLKVMHGYLKPYVKV
jgi:NAD(P)-dependent dehydrogenase (short-subunit alcohol dehydrogenase family)